jgi:glucose-fructose oxidoreductase
MSARNGKNGSTPKVRYAVVGLGYIAQVAVLPAFAHAKKNSMLAGLVSDEPSKLKQLGRKYGVENLWTYEQFDDCLASDAIDAVYIALPNALHAEFVVRAARAGVHVLCEKPLATSEQDCQAMLQAARENGVKLMTAYRLHFERANTEAIEIVRSGRIGDPRIFDSVFTMQVKDPDNIRLKRDVGGGTLWDIGIYCINAARYIFRSEPVEALAVTATAADARFAEVEEMTSAILRFPEDRLATFTCSFGASDVSSYRVVGTRGDLCVEPAYEFTEELCHTLTVGGRTRERTFAKRDQFAPELLHLSQCIQKDTEPEPSGEEGLADVRIIEALYQSAEEGGRPIPLDPLPRSQRPSRALEQHRPPVKKPKLVHVRSPSD